MYSYSISSKQWRFELKVMQSYLLTFGTPNLSE